MKKSSFYNICICIKNVYCSDKIAIVSRPTSVLNPIVLSRLSDNTFGPGLSDMSLDDMFDTKNYCVSWGVFAAALLRLAFLLANLISKFSVEIV